MVVQNCPELFRNTQNWSLRLSHLHNEQGDKEKLFYGRSHENKIDVESHLHVCYGRPQPSFKPRQDSHAPHHLRASA